MKKILLILILANFLSKSQNPAFLNWVINVDSVSMELQELYKPSRNVIKVKDTSQIFISLPIIYFPNLVLSSGTPSAITTIEYNGQILKRAISSLTFTPLQITSALGFTPAPVITQTIIGTNGINVNSSLNTFTISKIKRQETYTSITNSVGIASFTFSSFSSTPNIQYNPGYGFGNKETCIPNAVPTNTSCSFYVQLRADVLGLLPNYSNVVGREVNILITEK